MPKSSPEHNSTNAAQAYQIRECSTIRSLRAILACCMLQAEPQPSLQTDGPAVDEDATAALDRLIDELEYLIHHAQEVLHQ